MDPSCLIDPYDLRMTNLLETLSVTSSLLRIRDLVCFAGQVTVCDCCSSSLARASVLVLISTTRFVCTSPRFRFEHSRWCRIHKWLFAACLRHLCLAVSGTFERTAFYAQGLLWSRNSRAIIYTYLPVLFPAGHRRHLGVHHPVGAKWWANKFRSTYTVIDLWSAKYMLHPYRAPIAPQTTWNPSGHIGIHAFVGDLTSLHLCANTTNVVVTFLSPPCPTWSRAGKVQGLCHPSGWAFIELLEVCMILQPSIITAECVDEFTHHPHHMFVIELLQRMGYTRVFNQVVNHHLVSNHFRSRWFATWVRSDHHPWVFDARISLQTIPRIPWASTLYSFDLPTCWERQLKLSDSELDIYSNVVFLPGAKRRTLQASSSPQQILESRFPKSGEPLPTLCASYSSQHLLVTEATFDQKVSSLSLRIMQGECHFLIHVGFAAFLEPAK